MWWVEQVIGSWIPESRLKNVFSSFSSCSQWDSCNLVHHCSKFHGYLKKYIGSEKLWGWNLEGMWAL